MAPARVPTAFAAFSSIVVRGSAALVVSQVEVDQPLPLGKFLLFDPRARIGDDRAAADRVDEDVDAAEFLVDRGGGGLELTAVEGITQLSVRGAARSAQRRHRLVEAAVVAERRVYASAA